MKIPLIRNYFGGGLATVASLSLLSACALPPESNDMVANAQETVEQAQQSPAVTQHAPLKLQEAQASLDKAESLWEEYGDDRIELIEHHAYLAQQQALTAVEMASLGQAREQAAQAGRARDQVLLQAREQQLQTARARAAQAELEAIAAQDQARSAQERIRDQQSQDQAQANREQANREQARREEQSRELQELRETVQSLKAQQTERGMVLTMDDVLFDFGESELKSGGERAVQQLASFLEENPDRQLLVEGYTDAVGDEQFNQRLSQERADAVREQLLAAGISSDRIEIRGHGEQYPIANNDTSAGRQLNRRVEVVIGNGGSEPEPRSVSPQQEQQESSQQQETGGATQEEQGAGNPAP